MAPGLPAAWPSRCAVCLLAAAGAALGPPGGPAHGAPAPERPPLRTTAVTAPGLVAAPGTAPAAPPATPSAPSPSALPSPLRLPLGAPEPVAPEPGGPLPGGPASGTAPTGPGGGTGAPAGPEAEPPASSPSPSASPQVSGSTAPLAGRGAAAGRPRPGRSPAPLEAVRASSPETAPEPESGIVNAVELPSSPPPDAFTDPAQRARGHALDAASARRVQQVSLGSGIALVGLGIAFLAFRLRRTT